LVVVYGDQNSINHVTATVTASVHLEDIIAVTLVGSDLSNNGLKCR